ncbi:hypothetical protein ElyMa_004916200 [Elysia marginata]|uniref:Uncharacterized protein n=1 Tax=Elysia marginata TaxID=1093978 RepID=A0AAV4J1F4_9GAST|nr:hypothetical protein ElyMa_004916200 [Elysia marginata]
MRKNQKINNFVIVKLTLEAIAQLAALIPQTLESFGSKKLATMPFENYTSGYKVYLSRQAKYRDNNNNDDDENNNNDEDSYNNNNNNKNKDNNNNNTKTTKRHKA